MLAIFIEQAEIFCRFYMLDLGRYLISAGGVYFVLSVLLSSWSEKYRIQKRRASVKDIIRECTHSLRTLAVWACIILVIQAAMKQGWNPIYRDIHAYPIWYTLISLPLLFILHDAYFYWTHRALHHPALYRRLHRSHHISVAPTPWACLSFSVGEALLMPLFLPLVMLLLPLNNLVILIFFYSTIMRVAMGHAGIEFHPKSWVDSPLDIFTSTTHHDMHHSRFQGNYGLYFTYWDRWMATELADYKETFRRAAGHKAANPNNPSLPNEVA